MAFARLDWHWLTVFNAIKETQIANQKLGNFRNGRFKGLNQQIAGIDQLVFINAS
jgi:hypothetical protein